MSLTTYLNSTSEKKTQANEEADARTLKVAALALLLKYHGFTADEVENWSAPAWEAWVAETGRKGGVSERTRLLVIAALRAHEGR